MIRLKHTFKTLLLLVLTSFTCLSNAQDTPSDEEILKLYTGLRVADLSDGMDMVGLRDVGLMDTRIEALWRDIDDLSHIVCGIAVTARYVPTNRVVKNPMNSENGKVTGTIRSLPNPLWNSLSPGPSSFSMFRVMVKPGLSDRLIHFSG